MAAANWGSRDDDSLSINKMSIQSHYFRSGMPQSSPAPFLRDPITVPRKEVIEHYRAQAARYGQLAERHPEAVSEGLLNLARQCNAMADALAGAKPELSQDEILRLLTGVVAQEGSISTAAAERLVVEGGVMPDLSLDDILQKIQRDIADGRPAAS
jgi:hypothetical protein